MLPRYFERSIKDALVEGLRPTEVFIPGLAEGAENCVDKMLAPVLGDDPVFGHMNNIGLEAFFEEAEP